MKTSNTIDTEFAPTTTPTDGIPTSDEELMGAIQLGDAHALEILMFRYRGLLKSVILRVVHDHAAADDVLQDCLVEIWKHAGNFSITKGKPLGWMITLAKRRAIDSVRRQVSYCSAMDRLEIETGHCTFTQAPDCEAVDLASVLQQHIQRLPENQQEVIRLAFLQGMSQREVARATHTPLGTVKTRMELGLRKLRAAFRTGHGMPTLQAA